MIVINGNKGAILLTRLFNLAFFAVFSLVLGLVALIGYIGVREANSYSTSPKQHIAVLFSAALISLAFGLIYHFMMKLNSRGLGRTSSLDFRALLVISVGVMLLCQLSVGYLLVNYPVTDVDIVNGYALDFAKTGSFHKIQRDYNAGYYYMIRYPNNFMNLFIWSFVFRTSYLLTGSVPRFLPVAINTLCINAGVLLTVLLARKIMGGRRAVFVLVLCLLFAPFYTYTAFCYTDSLSLPLMVGVLYMIVSAAQSKDYLKTLILLSAAGAVAFLGYKLKGSLIILPVGAVVYLVLRLGFRKMLCAVLALGFGFIAVGASYNTAFKNADIVTASQADECEFPPTHWIMMGLKGYGNYHKKDVRYTEKRATKDKKTAADLKKIKRRLRKMGKTGLLRHITRKLAWTWADGTYYVSHHIDRPVHPNPLHSLVLNSGRHHFAFVAYSNGYQLFLLIMMLLSALRGFINPKVNSLLLLRGLVFGALLFFLIWETRSRYLYNFTPLFIISAADGIDFVYELAKKYSPVKRGYINRGIVHKKK